MRHRSLRRQGAQLECCLRLKEAAAIQGVSVSDLRRRLRRGELGYIRRGKLILIPVSEIDRWRRRYYVPPIEGVQRD